MLLCYLKHGILMRAAISSAKIIVIIFLNRAIRQGGGVCIHVPTVVDVCLADELRTAVTDCEMRTLQSEKPMFCASRV